MPKMKTHRGAAKRFKITGTGKILRRKAYRDHLLEKKSSRRTRRLGRVAEVPVATRKRVKRLLGRVGRHGTREAFRQRQKHRRAILEEAKGYTGSRSRHFRKAQRAGHALAAGTRTATAGPARASSGGCGSCASTPRAASTTSRTRGSSPA